MVIIVILANIRNYHRHKDQMDRIIELFGPLYFVLIALSIILAPLTICYNVVILLLKTFDPVARKRIEELEEDTKRLL